jgi:solute carrier family 25 carnitine/acylcarnitine transporter 20/29
MDDLQKPVLHPHQQLYEFIAGCLGGVTQVIIGQPFDTVKVRLQNQVEGKKVYTSMTDCIKKIYTYEGPTAFYKGVLPPLLAVGGCSSIQFGVLETTKRFFLSLQSGTKKELEMRYIFLSGAVAGLANSIISIPAEHLRIRMQIQQNSAGTSGEYRSSIDAAKKIYKKHGIQGIYKGGFISAIREMYAYGIYFATYELALRTLMQKGQKRTDLHPIQYLIGGSLAGYVVWFMEYPLDLVKTKIQADSFVHPQYRGSVDCAIQTYRSGGIHGFYRGLLPCMLRAGPANAASFLTYEYAMKFFTHRDH